MHITVIETKVLFVGDRIHQLSDFARYVATDEDGEVWEYADYPEKEEDFWNASGECNLLCRLPNDTDNGDWDESVMVVGGVE